MPKGVCLLIEDSQTQARLLGQRLAELDWEYQACASVDDAIVRWGQLKVDVILTDLFLEDGEALDQFHRMRQIWPLAPIVVMTAGGAGADAYDSLARANEKGADFLLIKPFSIETMDAVMDDALAVRHGGARKLHVLVVDDSPTVLKIAARMLVDRPCRISISNQMEDVLRRLVFDTVDVVVTDIFMPGMGGIEGIRRMREQFPGVALVAMSGGLDQRMDQDAALLAARKIGADRSLSKPFTDAALWDAVTMAADCRAS